MKSSIQKFYLLWMLLSINIIALSQTLNSSNTVLHKDSINNSSECFTFIPNAFCPDEHHGSGVFDYHMECDVTDFEIKIFNQFGELIFQTKKVDEYWDGEDCFQGLYLYHFRVKYKGYNSLKYIGKVYLIE